MKSKRPIFAKYYSNFQQKSYYAGWTIALLVHQKWVAKSYKQYVQVRNSSRCNKKNLLTGWHAQKKSKRKKKEKEKSASGSHVRPEISSFRRQDGIHGLESVLLRLSPKNTNQCLVIALCLDYWPTCQPEIKHIWDYLKALGSIRPKRSFIFWDRIPSTLVIRRTLNVKRSAKQRDNPSHIIDLNIYIILPGAIKTTLDNDEREHNWFSRVGRCNRA